MKVPLSWLREYVQVPWTASQLAHRLTMTGTEVGGLHRTADAWDSVTIALLTGIEPHPNADRLRLATVSLRGENHTVVCGAPNLEIGSRVAFAQTGATIRDSRTGELSTLKPATIRGVASAGMLCSERELGISDEHEGILVLPADAPLDTALADYLGDVVLDVELTRNRADCFGILGIAREAAVLANTSLREPDGSWTGTGPDIASLTSVTVEDPDVCPRYMAAVIRDVTIGPSPQWLQDRLLAAGMRPINNVVDVTNFVMLEYGQPLHAFDYDTLRGRRIVVRRAGSVQPFTTLDGIERQLSPEMLMICDAEGPVALAGVMGGANSEVSAATTTVLLESASFENLGIRRTARRLGIWSEAFQRFEKRLSREFPALALDRAMHLLEQVTGGTPSSGVIDVRAPEPASEPIAFGTDLLARKLGTSMDAGHIQDVLTRLGCTVEATGHAGAEFLVTPPHWRTDLTCYDDLIEEVARITGYEAIPETILSGELMAQVPNPERALRERIADLLSGLGCQEVITYTLLSRTAIDAANSAEPGHRIAEPIRLWNAMTEDQAWLRTTLRPSLLQALATNQRHAANPIRLFEVGRVFLSEGPDALPEQKYILGVILAGPRAPRSWEGPQEPSDFFDAKGLVEALLDHLGVTGLQWGRADDEPFYVPGQNARLRAGDTSLGSLGRIAPEVLRRFDIGLEDAFYVGLSIPMLLKVVPAQPAYTAPSRFPALLRDFAIVARDDVPAAAIEAILRGPSLVRDVTLFDIYTGDPVPAGHRSLAFSVRFQAPDRTLAERDIDGIQKGILARLQKEFGATLR